MLLELYGSTLTDTGTSTGTGTSAGTVVSKKSWDTPPRKPS